MPPNGKKNMRPPKTKEEAKLRGANGGRRSGEVRRQKRDLRERTRDLLFSKATVAELSKAFEEKMGVNIGENIDYLVAIAFKKTLEGDLGAAKTLAEWADLNPATKVELSGDVKITNDKLTKAELKKMIDDFEND